MATGVAAGSLMASGGAGAAAGATGIGASTMLMASAGVGAIGTLYQGYQAYQQSKFERQQLDMQARATKIDSLTKENDRRRTLLRTLSSRIAISGVRGVDLTSGSLQRITDSDVSESNRANRMANLNLQTELADIAAKKTAAGKRGRAALIGSVIKVGTSLLSAGAQAKALGGPAPGGSTTSTAQGNQLIFG